MIPLRVAGDLVKAWQDGAGTTRGWIIAAVGLMTSGGISASFSTLPLISDVGLTALILGGAAALVARQLLAMYSPDGVAKAAQVQS